MLCSACSHGLRKLLFFRVRRQNLWLSESTSVVADTGQNISIAASLNPITTSLDALRIYTMMPVRKSIDGQ